MSIVLRWGLVVAMCYAVLVAMGGFIGTFMGYTFSEAATNVALMSAFLAYMPAAILLGGFLYVISLENKVVMPIMAAVSGRTYDGYFDKALDGPFSVFRAICAGCFFACFAGFLCRCFCLSGYVYRTPSHAFFLGRFQHIVCC